MFIFSPMRLRMTGSHDPTNDDRRSISHSSDLQKDILQVLPSRSIKFIDEKNKGLKIENCITAAATSDGKYTIGALSRTLLPLRQTGKCLGRHVIEDWEPIGALMRFLSRTLSRKLPRDGGF